MQSALELSGDGQLDRIGRAARYRLKSGHEVVTSLRSAAQAFSSQSGANAARVSAALIESCCDNSNVWVACDLNNDAGELFDSSGTLTSCYERLCPNCLRKRSAQCRRRARAGIAQANKVLVDIPGLRWRFITLTFPTIKADQLSLVDSLSLIQDAWRKLSRLQWWRDNVRASIKGVEFTLGDDSKDVGSWRSDRDGYHTHLHLLVSSHWLNARALSLEWTAILKMELARRGLVAPHGTREGRYIIDIREVKDVVGKPGFTSLDRAVLEVSKYITKCASWSHLPSEQLLAVAAIQRWPRMFELGGACRVSAEAEPVEWSLKKDNTIGLYLNGGQGCLPLLDTECLSVTDWNKGPPQEVSIPRVTMKQKGLALLGEGKELEFREILRHALLSNREFRLRQLQLRYPFACFWLIATNEKGM